MQIDERWHVSKNVPMALVLAIVIQSVGLGAWGGSMMMRLSNVEMQAAVNSTATAQLLSLQTQIVNLKEAITDLRSELRLLRERRSGLFPRSSTEQSP